MKKVSSAFILLLFFFSGKSQGISNVWIVGLDTIQNQYTGRTLIDFKTGVSVVSYNNQYLSSFSRTSATIADSNGSLLFYTNGFDVSNYYGQVMPKGGGIDSSAYWNSFWYKKGMPSSQGALILPAPGIDSLYYLFHVTTQPPFLGTDGAFYYCPNSLYYSIIDMKSDSGKGDLIVREQTALSDTLTVGRITAVKHANGRDWWVLVYRYKGNGYIKLLLTPQGISSISYQFIGPHLSYLDLGQAVFSSQGDKYAISDAINGVLIMNFDRCSGVLSNPTQITFNDSSYLRGCAFSPNGRFLYVSGNNKYLYQFDTWASNINSTKDTVAIWDGYYSPSFPYAASFYLMQLAPDGKIYIVPPNGVRVMHTIDNPDSAGSLCGVCQHCVSLPTYNTYTLPNHPNYFLGADSGSVCDTLQLGILNSGLGIQNEKLTIFPNPANDFIQLAYTPNDKLRIIEIVAVDGRIVLKLSIPQWSQLQRIDVSKLNAGMYLCRFVGGKGGTVKFVVNMR